jgi:hypothetical protein
MSSFIGHSLAALSTYSVEKQIEQITNFPQGWGVKTVVGA